MGSPSAGQRDIDSICIIGAGPSGLACAKYLLAERAFSQISVIEQRAESGGLWNYIPWEGGPKDLAVPQISPDAGLDHPVWTDSKPSFMTAVYESLETNIPRDLMGFSDLDWPEDSQLFPQHEAVLAYIRRYARDLHHLITFGTQVLDVRQDARKGWFVTTREVSQEKEMAARVHHFDAVVVASGHYIVPHVPHVSGIEKWNEMYPSTITHSKFYRRPDSYAGKKVVVVGNAASGIDIGAQIMKHCKSPMLQSQRAESYLLPDPSPHKVEKPEIVEYITTNRSLRFADGTVESDVDSVVYCTGYFYSYPFLKSLSPPVITTGQRVENTYQHIFYRPDPTLALLVLNSKVIPFPLAEAQSAVIARVFSGRLALPNDRVMRSWEEKVVDDTGSGRSFHVLQFPKDANYINMLHDWAVSADMGDGKAKVGKTPPRWGEKKYWIRERFPLIKKAFQDFGEERHTKRTLEDVGFDPDEGKAARSKEEGGVL